MTSTIEPAKPVGRPTVMTEETVKKLIDVFRLGVNDSAACSYAGISRQTFYARLQDDEVFSDNIQSAKHYAIIAARQVVVKSIVEGKDLDTAKWYIEKHDMKNDQPQQNTQVNVFNVLKEKYTINKGTEGQMDEKPLPDITIESKHG